MARGQSTNSPSAVSRSNLQGKALRHAVYLSRAAVDNHARFTRGSQDTFKARLDLLEIIETQGELSYDLPEWMTSAKPGVDAYIHLDGHSLTLSKDGKNNRPWLVTNCLAPRRRPNRRTESLKATEANNSLDVRFAAHLATKDSAFLADRVRITEHAVERFNQRTGLAYSKDEILELIKTKGKVVTDVPAWANATRSNTAVLICKTDKNEVAFALGKDGLGDKDFVLASAMDKRWAYEDLATALHDLELPTKLVEEWASRSGTPIHNESSRKRITADLVERLQEIGEPSFEGPVKGDTGAWIHVGGDSLQLRPISSTVKSKKRWLAEAIV